MAVLPKRLLAPGAFGAAALGAVGAWYQLFKRPLPKTLSRDGAQALVERPDTTRLGGLRDRAMLEMLYATGMRASECLGRSIEDLKLSDADKRKLYFGNALELLRMPAEKFK